jgi:hypothetical protein
VTYKWGYLMKLSNDDLTNLGLTPEQIYVFENLIERIEALETKGVRFKKPELIEVQRYMAEKGCQSYLSEAEKFIDYFEQVGWVVGKTKKPMKAWKSAVNNWLKNNYSQPAPEQKQAVRSSLRNIHDTSW